MKVSRVAAVFGGGLFGMAAAAAFALLREPASVGEARAGRQPVAAATSGTPPAEVREKETHSDETLELRRGSRKSQPADGASTDDSVEASDPLPPPRNAEEKHDALVEESLAESLDRPWATHAEASLSRDLVRLGDSSFDVSSVACRTTSCVATLEWPSFNEATMSYNRLVTHDYEVNCTRTITLPEPEDPLAPYEAKLVIYECSRE